MAVADVLCALLVATAPELAAAAGCEVPDKPKPQAPAPRKPTPPVPGPEEPGVRKPGRIAPGHVLNRASAEVAFAAQRGYSVQALGKHPAVKAIPESGIHGPPLPDGETLRFGKVTDPADPRRRALAFRLSPLDPDTSGAKRAEISFAPAIEMERTYWIALRVYVYDWGDESGAALFGTQVHSGDNRLGLSPTFAIYTHGARHFRIQNRYSKSPSPSQKNTITVRHETHPIPFERWTDFVFRFRHSTEDDGVLQAWMDGKRIVDYRGPMGYITPGYRDYAKFGVYSWAKFATPRAVLLQNPTVVLDPTGDTYDAATLRAAVQ